MTRKPIGCIGADVPGGSTGRCTPFIPPFSTKVSSFEKLPCSFLNSADLAPIGSGNPTWAMTTPISPAGTCTHGNRSTLCVIQNFKRNPGISRSAW